ncbi:MAG: class II fructose-bisphosphate aldolase family protein [Candidatus Kerfeldbacteria bacterium]|nr:class II fructose-bisphosphate aldolase family protein [Candidatus Kerfeldbacteria bacterium]
MLVTVRQLLAHAQHHGYAVGAFNTVNLEMTLGIIRGAVDANAPVVIQVTETTIQYAGLKPITHIVETIAKNAAVNVPVALHLDHGRNFRSIAECINAGFSSIMIDASDLPYDENVVLTKQAVDYAHKHGVQAQGEIGQLKKADDSIAALVREKYMTDPIEAESFVKATGVDSLAVAIGNVYGIAKMERGAPPLDLDRLNHIHGRIPSVPLVLHGASALKPEAIRLAVNGGIRVINIVTEIEHAFTSRLRHTLQAYAEEYDPRIILEPSIESVQRLVAQKLRDFGSSGAAKDFLTGQAAKG